MRSHYCGELNARHLGRQVTIAGWVNRRRDLGGLIFLELRDRLGLVQVVVEPVGGDAFELAQTLRSEYVITVSGTVRARPSEQRSQRMASGEVEILADNIDLLAAAQTPPFTIDGSVDAEQINEDLRLRHRYLDLRRPEAARPLLLRHQLSKAIWDYLDAQGFIQVETPLLTRSTPEGARDFVVPARQQAGTFYALPQSPQLFKQLLMIAGFDRYFQIARCFRDEDLRADRQPDFTQLDLEMSFVDQEDILTLNEGLMQHLIKRISGREITIPFPRLPYREALNRYGSDKPDRRFELELLELSGIWQGSDFRAFRSALEGGGCVKGIAVTAPQASKVSRKALGDLDATARAHGAPGLAWLRQAGEGFSGPIAKFLGAGESQALAEHAPAVGDLLLLVAGPWRDSCQALGAVRLALVKLLGITLDPQELDFLWVVDFPLLKADPEGDGFTYMHHPFTRPRDEDLPLLESRPQAVRAWAYDLVLNGHEIGGGSLRIHQLALQEQLFELLGFSREEAHRRFGFFLQALRYGAPPHGGIAWGLDRLIMLLSGANSLRNVIAFPKNQRGVDPLTGAPAPLEAEQLRELKLAPLAEEPR